MTTTHPPAPTAPIRMRDVAPWKVPFRSVYCDSFRSWLKQTFWCHVVIKVFPHLIDLASDPQLHEMVDSPEFFHEQYRGFISRAMRAQGKVECRRPPAGWRCTRGVGHEGPCAAVEKAS